MRYPSIKTLAYVFEDPKRARDILTLGPRDPKGARSVPGVNEHFSDCYRAPSVVDVKLQALAMLDPGLHGVENIVTPQGQHAEYLNSGDTYTTTLIFWCGQYRVQSLGDFIETMERQNVRFN